jgi:hypothetical protein
VCYPLPRSLAFRMLSVPTRLANGESVVDSTKAARLFFPDINSAAMRKVVEFITYEWREGEVLIARPGAFKSENQAL